MALDKFDLWEDPTLVGKRTTMYGEVRFRMVTSFIVPPRWSTHQTELSLGSPVHLTAQFGTRKEPEKVDGKSIYIVASLNLNQNGEWEIGRDTNHAYGRKPAAPGKFHYDGGQIKPGEYGVTALPGPQRDKLFTVINAAAADLRVPELTEAYDKLLQAAEQYLMRSASDHRARANVESDRANTLHTLLHGGPNTRPYPANFRAYLDTMASAPQPDATPA